MRGDAVVVLFLLLPAVSLLSQRQPWKPILSPAQAIDWSKTGVGEIPARTTLCASLTPSATLAQVNAALASCPSGQAVYLAAGVYAIPGTILVPSNVTLRGAGADRTILNATGKTRGNVVSLGFGSVPYRPVNITGGATEGSTSILVGGAAAIHPGMYLTITEINDPTYVSSAGSEGLCKWCDGGWTNTDRKSVV